MNEYDERQTSQQTFVSRLLLVISCVTCPVLGLDFPSTMGTAKYNNLTQVKYIYHFPEEGLHKPCQRSNVLTEIFIFMQNFTIKGALLGKNI